MYILVHEYILVHVYGSIFIEQFDCHRSSFGIFYTRVVSCLVLSCPVLYCTVLCCTSCVVSCYDAFVVACLWHVCGMFVSIVLW